MDTAHALTVNLAALLRREHDALAEFLVALADFDRRRAWAELGYPSLFSFLHRELHLSKAAAQYRKVAAELIQEIPPAHVGRERAHLVGSADRGGRARAGAAPRRNALRSRSAR
jgi:hypothetical protein